jgi:hypothetical protein
LSTPRLLLPQRRFGAIAGLLLATPLALGQGAPDFFISGTEVVQSVQTGDIGLTANKSTAVRMFVLSTGTVPPGTLVDGLMRVYVNGIELPESPIYSDNGPLLPLTEANPGVEDAALNFNWIPPQANNVSLVLELNPAGATQVAESNFLNNTAQLGPLAFTCKRIPELLYVPIDYRPNGELEPNLPDPELIKPGIGDGFIQGIYPSGDWDYHRTVLPSKLWTSSLSSIGSPLLSALFTDFTLLNPQPDYIYGWVPGPLPGYNGQAIGIPGVAGMGNTELIRFQRTAAHEVGHLTGLFHNGTTNGALGYDVERHLNLPLALSTIKDGALKDIMYAGLLTQEAWVAPSSYVHFQNIPTFDCATPDAPLTDASNEALLLTGEWDRATGEFALRDLLRVPATPPTPFVDLLGADLWLEAYGSGQLLGRFGLRVRSTLDCPACVEASDEHDHAAACGHEAQSAAGGTDGSAADKAGARATLEPLAVVLPATLAPQAIERLELIEPVSGRTIWKSQRSANAPQASILNPTPSTVIGATLKVDWSASDADGDALHSYLVYSPDGLRRIPLIAHSTANSATLDFAALPRPKVGQAYLELLVSDGLNTTRLETEGLGLSGLALGGSSNIPLVGIYTPDTGFRYPQGATVLLHANAWDIEDLYMDGPSVTWTSNKDGLIGTGRLTSAVDLSVGVHVITMRATDSSGASNSAAVTIVINARELPGPGTVICQPDLTFGGPGSALLSVCGEPLSSGNSATLAITGAAPSAPLWLGVSTSFNPFPALGGTLVTVPTIAILTGTTNASGQFSLPVTNNGAGPLTLFAQAVVLDFAQAAGFAITNAVQVNYLP